MCGRYHNNQSKARYQSLLYMYTDKQPFSSLLQPSLRSLYLNAFLTSITLFNGHSSFLLLGYKQQTMPPIRTGTRSILVLCTRWQAIQRSLPTLVLSKEIRNMYWEKQSGWRNLLRLLLLPHGTLLVGKWCREMHTGTQSEWISVQHGLGGVVSSIAI